MAKHSNSEQEQVPYDDLMGLDLADLDLDAIDLEADDGPSVLQPGDGLRAFVFIITLVGVVLVPMTDYYRTVGRNTWLFFVVAFAGIALGLLGGRWLFQLLGRAAERYAAKNQNRAPVEDRPPSALSRWMTLIVGVGGAVAIVVGMQSNPAVIGSGRSFLISIGAILVGMTFGRWLLMQEFHPVKNDAPIKPIKLPPWMKWVTLTVLLGTAVFILFSGQILGDATAKELEFTLGAVAFVVAIGGAIWLSKRFDETETKLRREHLARKERDRP